MEWNHIFYEMGMQQSVLIIFIIIEKFLMKTIRVSKSLDPDQARRFVGPDLGPNCLQRLSAGDTCM